MTAPDRFTQDEADALVARVADEYRELLRRGQRPDFEGIVAEHPGIAEELRAVLPAIEMMGAIDAGDLAEDGPQPLAAQAIGDFRLLREIGRGGMGGVYEAEQISLSRRVALKVLPFAAVLDQRQIQRFRNEAQAAALLNHPHIVSVYSVGSERGVHYYAMQFVEGLSGAELIEELRYSLGTSTDAGGQRPRLAPSSSAAVEAVTKDRSTRTLRYCRTVARLGLQAAEALEHAHAEGVVHRDIKPGNLLIDTSGHLWITDFGLARSKADSGLTLTGELMGTVRYMSPEQTRADRIPVDHRTDIYSLGVTLYELLTLSDAFPGEDIPRIMEDIRSKEPPLPRRVNEAVPADLETILIKATAKERDERYHSAKELAEDLRSFLEDRPIRAKRPGLVARAAKWVRRHRAPVGAAALAFLLALAVGAVLLQAAYRAESRERRQAELHFEKAREAVDLMLVEVGEKDLARVPGMERVRRRLLGRALEYYRSFLELSGDDPAVRGETARAYRRMADIHSLLGEHPQAEAALREAIALAGGPVADAADAGPTREIAAMRRELGDVLADELRPEEAFDEYERARRIVRGLLDADPDDSESWREMSRIRSGVGAVRLTAREFAAAEEEYRGALEIDERLVARHPGVIEHEGCLADSFARLGSALKHGAGGARAEAPLVRAIELYEGLTEDHPEEPRYRRRLAHALQDLGWLLRRAGMWEEVSGHERNSEAVAAYRRSLEIQEALVEESPDVPAHRWDLGFTSLSLAQTLRWMGDQRGAMEEYERGTRLAPSHYGLLYSFASFLADCGDEGLVDLPRACFLAEQAARIEPDDWNCWTILARVRYLAGDFAGAIEACETGRTKGLASRVIASRDVLGAGDNPYAWALLAMSHDRLGRREEAMRWYERVLAHYREGHPFRGLAEVLAEVASVLGLPDPTVADRDE